jgi:hypothetical protein
MLLTWLEPNLILFYVAKYGKFRLLWGWALEYSCEGRMIYVLAVAPVFKPYRRVTYIHFAWIMTGENFPFGRKLSRAMTFLLDIFLRRPINAVLRCITWPSIARHSSIKSELYLCYATYGKCIRTCNLVKLCPLLINCSFFVLRIDWRIDSQRAGWSGDRIPAGVRFFASDRTGPVTKQPPVHWAPHTRILTGNKVGGTWRWPRTAI